jgi:hypothetical protein
MIYTVAIFVIVIVIIAVFLTMFSGLLAQRVEKKASGSDGHG